MLENKLGGINGGIFTLPYLINSTNIRLEAI